MVEVIVAADGTIALPAAVSERWGIQPGTRLALEDEERDGSLSLRVLPAEAQLIDKEGVWVIRSQSLHPEDKDADWVDRIRAERSASVLGSP
jgi:bifunctional DNA-binding transcriptional regulator/antitoxin component of YhaV-PrlF toxin-antitoxin module